VAASAAVSGDTAGAFVRERAAFVATIAALGPEAPTLCGPWTCEDLAAHYISGERLAGVPTYVGRAVVHRGIRLGDRLAAQADRIVRVNRRKGFDWIVHRLRQPPPSLLARGSVAVMSLLESWIHHEDLRRANELGRRPDEPDLAPCIDWALRYHRSLLRDVGLRVSFDGERRSVGPSTPSITVAGPPGEVLLWLAGRPAAAGVEVGGDPEAITPMPRLRF
jgi:uncharacterized protein (TIGR03085 family)